MRVADLIVASLKAHGVTRVYCVPGESYLALLDALHGSGIQVIVCRHESGAGFMAVAEAKITGRPSVCLVSRGPGATNASIAVHTAEQDAAPMILFVGQVSRVELGRGAFQEVDYTQFFGRMAKGVTELAEADKTAETLLRGFRLAAEGVPGPVVISLPEDVLEDETPSEAAPPFAIARPRHTVADAEALQELIDESERPLVMAGGALRGARGAAALERFAQAQRIPVAVTWKNQDVFDNGSELYAGHMGFGTPAAHREILSGADLIIAAGTRLGDVASLNYRLPQAPEPRQRLVHIYPAGGPVGRVFRTDLAILADPSALLDALAHRARVVTSQRETWISSVNDFVRGFMAFSARPVDDGVDFGAVTDAIARLAPANCVVTTDAGNMSTWVHRHWRMTPDTLLIGAIAGAMGFGVPAAVAAALEMPDRTAIAFVGDGGVLMTGQELATAMQYGAAVKIVISDNGTYGTIRTHQERDYPGRVSGTQLSNPDFTRWATSFGAACFTLKMGEDIDATVRAFLSSPGAAVLHVKSSRESLSAYATLSGLKS